MSIRALPVLAHFDPAAQLFYHWREGKLIEVLLMTEAKARERRGRGWDLRPVTPKEK